MNFDLTPSFRFQVTVTCGFDTKQDLAKARGLRPKSARRRNVGYQGKA